MSDQEMYHLQNSIVNRARKLKNRIEIREDVTDTARNIRTALKRSIPGVKFSVRSERYSGGSSVTVKPHRKLTNEEMENYIALDEQFDPCVHGTLDDVHNVGYVFDGKKRAGPQFIFFEDSTGNCNLNIHRKRIQS